MPVPKRKTSKARRDQRASSKFIRPQAVALCSNCEHAINTHQVCANCGFYKGRKILVTKLERALKRGQVKQASEMQAKSSHEGHDHDEHGHDHNHDNENAK